MKRNIFHYRTRTLDYGENFRGSRSQVPCPFLCTNASDSQLHSLHECIQIKNKINIEATNDDFMSENISTQHVHDLNRLLKIRKQELEIFCPNLSPFY